jgi:hypothetical protein
MEVADMADTDETAPRTLGALSVGQLADAIQVAIEGGGAFGQNLHPQKPVMIKVAGSFHPLSKVSVVVVGDEFSLVLEAGTHG